MASSPVVEEQNQEHEAVSPTPTPSTLSLEPIEDVLALTSCVPNCRQFL